MNKFHVIDGCREKIHKPRTPIQFNDFQGDVNRFFRRISIIIHSMRQPLFSVDVEPMIERTYKIDIAHKI